MRLMAFLFLAGVLGCRAADLPAGRWEGPVDIPGREVKLVVDLDADRAGVRQGSITIPGLNVKGAPLVDPVRKGAAVTFTIQNALSNPRMKPATLTLQPAPKGRLAGIFQQGGNTAIVVLERTGPPQVDPPRRGSPLAAGLLGEWTGRYELGGYPREVTLKLANQGDTAKVEFVIVGKRVNNLPVAYAGQDGEYLVVEAPTYAITYEARLQRGSGELQGTLTQGSIEVPLVLQRKP